jgi:hypothetical protein
MPGGDPRHLDLWAARGARTDCLDRAPRQARHDRVRQRDRVHLERHARLDAGQQDRLALRRESRCRTAFVRASTAACATSFSTRACSSTLTIRDQGLRTGKDCELDRRLQPAAAALGAGYLTPAAYAANLSAPCDRLRNPNQLSRSHVAPPAPHGVKPAEALSPVG